MSRKPSAEPQGDAKKTTCGECLYNFVAISAGKADDVTGTVRKGGHDGIMIHPESNAKLCVMVTTLVLLLYLCVAVPLVIGFELEPSGLWGGWEVCALCVAYLVCICVVGRGATSRTLRQPPGRERNLSGVRIARHDPEKSRLTDTNERSTAAAAHRALGTQRTRTTAFCRRLLPLRHLPHVPHGHHLQGRPDRDESGPGGAVVRLQARVQFLPPTPAQ